MISENKARKKRERDGEVEERRGGTYTTDPLTTPPTAPTTALPKGESMGKAII